MEPTMDEVNFEMLVNNASKMIMNTLTTTGEFDYDSKTDNVPGWNLMESIGAVNSEGTVDYESPNQKEVTAFILFNALELYGLAQREINTPLDFDVIEAMIGQLEHLVHLKLKEK